MTAPTAGTGPTHPAPSGPSQPAPPKSGHQPIALDPSLVERTLLNVVANLRAALDDLTTLGLPLAGSAVPNAARQAQSCLSGGSSDHLAAAPVAASGGRTPGLVPPDGSGAVAPDRDAGASSDPREARRATGPGSASSVAVVAAGVGPSPGPRPRRAQRAPVGNDVRPRAGFTLPVTERFVMPGTDEIAVSINEALARRSQ